MRFVSLFSGIEAASVALDPLGWECVAFAEIEPFPSSLLARRFSHVPNLGDVTKVTELDVMMWGSVDVLIFGSPCQDLSVAGNRKGLAGERSGLFHDAMRIIRWARKHCGLRFAWWENVPGAFTSNAGRDFALVVGEMAGNAAVEVPPKGWGNEGAIVGEEAMVEWATLDAQWFGVAQRRRRVFAIADFGDWVNRPPILLEPESVRGDSAPCRGQGQSVAGTLTRGAYVGSAGGGDGRDGLLHVAGTLNTQMWRGVNQQMAHSGLMLPVCVTGEVTHALTAEGFDASEDGTGRGTPIAATYMPARKLAADGGVDEFFAERDVSDALHTSIGHGNKAPIVAYGGNNTTGPIDVATALNAKGGAGRMDFESETLLIGFYPTNRQPDSGNYENVAPTLKVGSGGTSANAAGVAGPFGVRRFTPLECERLQGFPDGWTAINKAADGPRYKALGNSMAVPVINWIGRSLEAACGEFWQ